jgi:serine/threonine-protein phosphatase 5
MGKNDKKEVDPTDATAQKNAGNAAFQAGKTEESIEYYTKAIELDSKQAAYYSNRAQAYIKLKAFKKALEDADSAITVDANFARAYVRKAQC